VLCHGARNAGTKIKKKVRQERCEKENGASIRLRKD